MKNNKISVIIPTLQKNKEILIRLIESLDRDCTVDEILLIDNSLKGFKKSAKNLRL